MDAAEKLRVPPDILSGIARTIVDTVIREHCGLRGWSLAALAVRTNRVHVVIVNPSVTPETIVQQLKQWATRRLRGQQLCGASDPVWARHASTRFLYEKGTVEKAVDYVLNHQDEARTGTARRSR
ncbi:MAG TPA: transposase, partial [Phycisphaerales bacterium]|nr:transposase [Phycisphaerales bacterium]